MKRKILLWAACAALLIAGACAHHSTTTDPVDMLTLLPQCYEMQPADGGEAGVFCPKSRMDYINATAAHAADAAEKCRATSGEPKTSEEPGL